MLWHTHPEIYNPIPILSSSQSRSSIGFNNESIVVLVLYCWFKLDDKLYCILIGLYNIRSIQYWIVLNRHCKAMTSWGCSWIVSRPSIVAESISYIDLHKLLKIMLLLSSNYCQLGAWDYISDIVVLVSSNIIDQWHSSVWCVWSSQFSYSDEHDGIISHLYAKILTSED